MFKEPFEFGLLLLREHRSACWMLVAAILESRFCALVVAVDKDANPVGGVADDRGNLGGGLVSALEPDDLPMGAFDRVGGSAVALVEFVRGKVLGQSQMVCHGCSRRRLGESKI